MTRPYTFKIMAALPGQPPVELFRTHGKYSSYTWRFVTRGMDAAWRKWDEHTTPDTRTITSRPVIARKSGAAKLKVHLSKEEKQEIGL